MRRTVSHIAVAFTIALLAPGSARAATPPCFPERTISASSDLRDDHLRVFGGLRAGQVIRLRDEPADEQAKWVDVELAPPIAVRARMERRHMVVFASADIEVQLGLSWLLAGAPLTILSGDQQRARVVFSLDGEKPQLRPVEVSCELLRGTPPADIVDWNTAGPLQKGHDHVRGRPVDWDGERVLESDAGARSVPLRGGSYLWDGKRAASILVKLERARALVEIVDHNNWTRHRGWTARAGLRFRFKRTPDVICGCAEGAAWIRLSVPGRPSARLRDATPLRSIADDRALVTLPGDSPVTVLRVDGDQSLVVWTGHGTGRGAPQRIVLFGQLANAALTPVSTASVNAVVEGRVNRAPEGNSPPTPLVVRAAWESGKIPFEISSPVTPQGSFRLVSPVNRGRLDVWAEAPDGRHVSRNESVTLAAGKTASVVVTVDADDRASQP